MRDRELLPTQIRTAPSQRISAKAALTHPWFLDERRRTTGPRKKRRRTDILKAGEAILDEVEPAWRGLREG